MDTKAFIVAILGLLFFVGNVSADDPKPSLVGTWSNADSATRGVVKLAIAVNGDNTSIQAWGSCHPTPCDWGKTTLSLCGDSVDAKEFPYGVAIWEKDFAVTYMTLRREGDALVIDTYTIFKDKSGRSNYRSTERFKESKD